MSSPARPPRTAAPDTRDRSSRRHMRRPGRQPEQSAGPASSTTRHRPQVLSASAERGPDVNGWYNRPVAFAIAGDDATAGIQACPVYLRRTGRRRGLGDRCCTDRAGNQASRAFGLRFDCHRARDHGPRGDPRGPHRRAELADHAGRRVGRCHPDSRRRAREGDARVRRPRVGLRRRARVDNGVQYAYEVRVQDPAGNARSATVTAVPPRRSLRSRSARRPLRWKR